MNENVERTEGPLVIRHVPQVPEEIQSDIAKYQNARSAVVVGWFRGGLLIETRFADTSQLHYLRTPMGMREQITFNAEPFGYGVVPRGESQTGLLFTRDVGGGENYQMFWLDWESRVSSLLSDGKSRYTGIQFSPSSQWISYATNEVNGTDWDLHIRTLAGEKVVLQAGAGVGWSISEWHDDESRVLATKYISPIESELYEFEIEGTTRTRLLDDLGQISIDNPFYDRDGSNIYFVSDLNVENHHLFRLNRATGEIEDLTPELEWDIQSTHLSLDRTKLAYTINQGGFAKLHLVALPSFEPLPLPELPLGSIGSLRFTDDGTRLALSLGTATQPTDVYHIDLESQTLTRWTRSELGQINAADLVEPEAFSYPTFDDREIPAFIYKPNTEGPHPVLVYIHGGPESQYRPGFSTLFQYLQKELGIAIVAPNVRGSSGYGKTYLGLDNGYLREDSVRDIGSLLDWIASQDDLDETRIAVYGGSYGGYMVLASMVHFADRLCCGIETVGISNFVTFLEKTQGYRRDLRRVEYGDERDPEMRTFLESIAPLNHVDKMSKPMLIGQGLNDPRVPVDESAQIVAELERNDIPVWYILAKDEGHGFRKKSNRDYYNQVMSLFLQTHLIGS